MRFKGKLIKSQAYYEFRRKATIQGFIIMTICYPLSFLLSSLLTDNFAGIFVFYFVLLLLFTYFGLGSQKEMLKEISNKYLVLDDMKIAVQNSRNKDIEQFMIDQIDEGLLQFNILPIDESSQSVIDEFRGNFPRNHIKFKVNGTEKRYDFILDSHYGYNQLLKIKSRLIGTTENTLIPSLST